jgi:hypothetical protein
MFALAFLSFFVFTLLVCHGNPRGFVLYVLMNLNEGIRLEEWMEFIWFSFFLI